MDDIRRDDQARGPQMPSERQMRAMLEQAARAWAQLVDSDDANPIGTGSPVAAVKARGWTVQYQHKGLVLALDGRAAHVVGAHGDKVIALRAGGDE